MREKVEQLFKPFQIMILYFFDFVFKFIKLKKVPMVIGVDEIANNTFFLKNIFKESAISVNFSSNKFYVDNKYDYSINIQNKYIKYIISLFYRPYLLAKLSNQSDIFIYFWWTGFCVDREMDYKFLKKKNKKIVCIFVGSDIRSGILTQEYYKTKELDHFVNYTGVTSIYVDKRVARVAELADKYSDLIINPKNAQLSYLKSNKIVDNFKYMIKDGFLKKDLSINKKIKILHAPSNPIIKGTQLVRAAIKKLQVEGYDFEYIELINKSNKEVLELLDSSDIVLNQFYAEMPGLFGVEAMAKFNAVLMSGDYENLLTNGETPWVKTKYWEIYENLKYLLDNPEKVKEYAQNGYEFVKNNYTEEKVREFYIDTFYEHRIIDDKSIF